MGLALRFLRDDSGATAIEYGLIAALIAVGAIASFTAMGNGLVNIFGRTDSGAGAVFTEAMGEL
jgi:pilus assembly protein Flp/PilA